MVKYLVGIDIGGTTVKMGKFDLSGQLLEKWEITTDRSDSGSHILEQVANSLQTKISLSEIKGIGIGVPGPVSNGVVLNCVNLGWGSTNVEQEFQKYLQAPEIIVRVSNDANVAAGGEAFQGIAKGYQNVCLLTIGTGVGGGIIVNGKIVDGMNGVGGELGHLFVDRSQQFSCGCGKKGCLETVASATGIVNLAKKYAQKDPESLLNTFTVLSAKKVFDLAKTGDKAALLAVDEASDYLAYALGLVTLVNNPEIFVIGGGVSYAGKFFLDKIEEKYYQYVMPMITKANFALASLGNDAGIYGAAYLVR